MTDTDMTDTIIPKSDQLNADDLMSGARTFTIESVRKTNGEQPVAVYLSGVDRPYLPCKSMRRVMVQAWGPDAAGYVAHRFTLYRDPAIKFGGLEVGGIRISHMSHIEKRLRIALTETRGKRAPFTVQPLADEAPHDDHKALVAEMFRLLGQTGRNDKQTALDYISQAVDRTVKSSGDLTTDDLEAVIVALDAELNAPTLPDPEPAA